MHRKQSWACRTEAQCPQKTQCLWCNDIQRRPVITFHGPYVCCSVMSRTHASRLLQDTCWTPDTAMQQTLARDHFRQHMTPVEFLIYASASVITAPLQTCLQAGVAEPSRCAGLCAPQALIKLLLCAIFQHKQAFLHFLDTHTLPHLHAFFLCTQTSDIHSNTLAIFHNILYFSVTACVRNISAAHQQLVSF